jgi:thioredoxin reductase (NADPH)
MHDLIIIGAGPAGLAASIYASRYALKHLILGKSLGGTITLAHKVENFPGLPSLSGGELAQRFLDHVKKLGTKIESKEVIKISQDKTGAFTLETTDGSSYQTKSIILAIGTKRRELGVPGEKDFLGKGVSYCCACDASFYKGKRVVVVGGANAACSGAVHVARFAEKVYLLYRRSALRAEPAWIKELKKKKNIEILYETNIIEIKGEEKVKKILLDKAYQEKKELFIEGVFVEIGGIPATELVKKIGVKCDEQEYVITDNQMVTNIKGVYSAGDVNSSNKEFQQVVVAVAEGAVAATSVFKFIKSK